MKEYIQRIIKDNSVAFDLLGYGIDCYEVQITDNSFTWMEQSERPYYDVTISNENLFNYLDAVGFCSGFDDDYNPFKGLGHTQTAYKIEPSEVQITEDVIKDYLLNNNKFKVN